MESRFERQHQNRLKPLVVACWLVGRSILAVRAQPGPANYYEVLGVSTKATPTEIRTAYKAATMQISDSGKAEGQDELLREAFAVLSRPDQKRRYNSLELEVSKLSSGQQVPITSGKRDPVINLARDRPSWQSSTRIGGGSSDRAVDGKALPKWSDNSCSHTNPDGEATPWWTVDLGSQKAIGKVRFLNRLEASERLKNYQVFVGATASPDSANPMTWEATKACGDVVPGPAPAGDWVDIDCNGIPAQFVGIVLRGGLGGREILTLCEVEVFEHRQPNIGDVLNGGASKGTLAAARRYIREYQNGLLAPVKERRFFFLQRAAALFSEVLESIKDNDLTGFELMYKELSELPVPARDHAMTGSAALVPTAMPALLLVRAKILERVALSPQCRQEPTNCCPPAITRSSAGCLANALALTKLAGSLGRAEARRLFDLAVEGAPGENRPYMYWPSFWETCELYASGLGSGSASFSAFWDPKDPSVGVIAGVLSSPAALEALRSDVETVGKASAGKGAFEMAFPTMVEEGHWDRVVLYDGVRGWSSRWCGPQAAPRLQLCDLLIGKLPGEMNLLQKYYLLDNNEEVTISRLASPRTILRPHNGGTNARLNLDLSLNGGARTSFRVGGYPRRISADSASFSAGTPGQSLELLVYDACQDREVVHEGDSPFFFLQVGIMHPSLVSDLIERRARADL